MPGWCGWNNLLSFLLFLKFLLVKRPESSTVFNWKIQQLLELDSRTPTAINCIVKMNEKKKGGAIPKSSYIWVVDCGIKECKKKRNS